MCGGFLYWKVQWSVLDSMSDSTQRSCSKTGIGYRVIRKTNLGSLRPERQLSNVSTWNELQWEFMTFSVGNCRFFGQRLPKRSTLRNHGIRVIGRCDLDRRIDLKCKIIDGKRETKATAFELRFCGSRVHQVNFVAGWSRGLDLVTRRKWNLAIIQLCTEVLKLFLSDFRRKGFLPRLITTQTLFIISDIKRLIRAALRGVIRSVAIRYVFSLHYETYVDGTWSLASDSESV